MAPGLILAAPGSGSGKTTITLAVLRCLAQAGVRVAGAKAGPDYIDPGFHAAACGRPSMTLDPWAMRPGTIARQIGASDAELVICEGMMGLFDGAGRDGTDGSTADLALSTGWPVVLVVDAKGQSASVAALLDGFARHRPEIRLSGILFNRVGGPRHEAMLVAAAGRAVPEIPVLGCVGRDDGITLPSRHLGLVLAEEHPGLEDFLARAAALVRDTLDFDRLCGLARPALPMGAAVPELRPPGARIAIARDAAFAFLYPHLVEGWHRQGAEIRYFSPLEDESPGDSADSVFLPGGYPELHAGRLARAAKFMAGLAAAASRGAVIYGECGGYMVLGRALIDAAGQAHPMAGLLPIVTSMAAPRRHLGYRQALGLAGPWAGCAVRGHEFHFASLVEADPAAPKLWRQADADGASLDMAGHVSGSVSGSFLHLIDRAPDA